MIELVLGGARSGKSSYAEKQAIAGAKQRYYLATGQALDAEMQQRIARHQQDRDDQWITLEEPINIANTLKQHDSSEHCLVIDCLTLWLTNCLLADETCWATQKSALLSTLPQLQADVILVGNEVGLGIVPYDALSRRFVDEAGWLHQAIASLANKVTFVAAGLPLSLKA